MVAKFRIDSLAALARQLEFTPHEKRVAQLAAAEELLHTIDPARAYPLEFIVFRITQFRPRTSGEDLLTGLALQHDLGLLIERVSGTLRLRTDAVKEPVLAIEDVCNRFNVTSKTIQRWRRKGLPARRFVFGDGKCRVGFFLSSVERFFTGHIEQVPREANFSQVQDDERHLIARRALRLATACGCSLDELSRRIGKSLNRSPAAIVHLLRKHDQENPAAAIIPLAAADMDPLQRQRIMREYRRGVSLGDLASHARRPRTAVYRVILEERLAKLNRRKTRFIDDSLYHQDDAQAAIDAIVAQEDLMSDARPEDSRVPRDLPPFLADLYRTPLLSPAKERALFLKFNFHKFQFVTSRRELEPRFARSRDLGRLEHYLQQATHAKNAIVRANMRLVVSVARKHLRPQVSLAELMSEGSLVLLRAVESFDAHRGHRFSTYATFALMKGFARSVPEILSGRRGLSSDDELLATIPDRGQPHVTDRVSDREHVGRLLARLTERERAILLAHYGLGSGETPATFEQLGQRLGLTKQRVRQIERAALAKLRIAPAVLE